MSPARPALRPLVPADVPAVVALEQELFGPSAWTEPMIREELDAPGRWYVALDGPVADRGPYTGSLAPDTPDPTRDPAPRVVLAGYAGSWFDGDVAQVMTIGVAVRAQRAGFGRTLLNALIDRARADRASAVLLEVRVDNEAALALYAATGFEVLARRRRYYQPEDVDAWTMRLAL